MTQDNFEERIIKQYGNKNLSKEEINFICKHAINEGLICKEEIRKVGQCTTVELLNSLKKWNSAFLHCPINLDNSGESDYETIKEEFMDSKTPLNSTPIKESCFYTPLKNEDSSYISNVYNSPANRKYIKPKEIENPFQSPYLRKENSLLLESLCGDLKEKTEFIKRSANEKTNKEVKKLIERFIKYSEQRTCTTKKSSKYYFLLLIPFIALLFLYTPQPI